jgi:hypothetical protein
VESRNGGLLPADDIMDRLKGAGSGRVKRSWWRWARKSNDLAVSNETRRKRNELTESKYSRAPQSFSLSALRDFILHLQGSPA